MANTLKLSDARSFKLQPMKKNNWVFKFSMIPGNDDNQPDALAFVAHTCSAPSVQYGDITMKRMNEEFKYAGNPTWNDITCNFYDCIRNGTGNPELSAGDILYNWSCMVYNPLTGQMGYKTQYATSATLAQIDPAGNIIRAWNLFGIYPKQIQFGEGLDYGSGETTDISATFRYDLAVKVQDSQSATESA